MRGWPRFLIAAAALISLLVAPTAASGQKAADRPFKATLTGSVHWEFPGDSPSKCTVVTSLTDSTGQATHLGRVVTSWSHCPAEPLYVVDGRLTITAANGDLLFGRYDYDPAGGNHFFPISWTGGTGRFAQASGSVVVTFTVIPQWLPECDPVPDPFPCFDLSVTWPWSATIAGTIKY